MPERCKNTEVTSAYAQTTLDKDQKTYRNKMTEPSKSIYLYGPCWLHWGLVWDTFWGLFGFHLGSFWGPFWVRLGVQERLQQKTLSGPPFDLPGKDLGPLLGPKLAPCWRPWSVLGRSWAIMARSWVDRGPIFDHLGATCQDKRLQDGWMFEKPSKTLCFSMVFEGPRGPT